MEKLNKEIIREYADLHNQVMFREKDKEELNIFFQNHKEEMRHPKFLLIFAEQIELFSEEFYLKSKERCQFFYELWIENKETEMVNHFDLRSLIRLGVFEDEFGQILECGKLDK